MEKARQYSALTRSLAILVASLLPLSTAGLDDAHAASTDEEPIKVPSGALVYLQEERKDSLGDNGLTYRFRFIMPDLAQRVPSTTGSATDFVEGDQPPVDINLGEDGADMGDEGAADGEYIDDGMVDPGQLDLKPVIVIPGAEEAADAAMDQALADDGTSLPAPPDVLLKDPVHEDVVALCQDYALPRILKSGERPNQIVISIADRESDFGTFNPDVLQLFEAFDLPKDHDSCEWRPW